MTVCYHVRKDGHKDYVLLTTQKISELSLGERWRLLLFLAARHPSDTLAGIAQIRVARGQHQDIKVNSMSFGDQASRSYSKR